MILVVMAVGGGMYYRCFYQTLCVVNSKIKFVDRMYKIDRQAVGKFVQENQPEKNLKTVWLWQKSDKPGFNTRVQTANKPVWVEIRTGMEGKVLSKKGAEEIRITTMGENHKYYNKLILYVNFKHEDIYDLEIGGAFARSLRWYMGSKNWPNEESSYLLRRI